MAKREQLQKSCEEKVLRLEAELKSISEKMPSEVNFVELTHKAMSNLKTSLKYTGRQILKAKGSLLVRLFQKNGIFKILKVEPLT